MWEGHASKQRQTYKQIIKNDIQKGRKTLSNWNPRWRKQYSSEESETVSWATPPSQLLLSRQVWNRRVKTEGKELQGLGETIVQDTEARCSSAEENIGLHFKPCNSRAPGRTSGHSWQSEKFDDLKTHYRSETADFSFPLWSLRACEKERHTSCFLPQYDRTVWQKQRFMSAHSFRMSPPLWHGWCD